MFSILASGQSNYVKKLLINASKASRLEVCLRSALCRRYVLDNNLCICVYCLLPKIGLVSFMFEIIYSINSKRFARILLVFSIVVFKHLKEFLSCWPITLLSNQYPKFLKKTFWNGYWTLFTNTTILTNQQTTRI